jgi:uncharacterized protein YpmS
MVNFSCKRPFQTQIEHIRQLVESPFPVVETIGGAPRRPLIFASSKTNNLKQFQTTSNNLKPNQIISNYIKQPQTKSNNFKLHQTTNKNFKSCNQLSKP